MQLGGMAPVMENTVSLQLDVTECQRPRVRKIQIVTIDHVSYFLFQKHALAFSFRDKPESTLKRYDSYTCM